MLPQASRALRNIHRPVPPTDEEMIINYETNENHF